MLAQINRNVRRKELFLVLCFTSMISSFIFTATTSIYQLINPINTGVFRTWNNQRSTVLRTSQRSFPSNYITYFFNSNTFPSLKTPCLKSVFFQNCFLRVALNRPGFNKSVYVRTYVREKLVVLQKYYVRYRTQDILIQCMSYFLFVTEYLSKQAKSKLHKVKVNHW